MFQQDVACVHTSKATITWQDANAKFYIPLKDRPPNSADFSPIENIWTITSTAI